MTALVGVGSVEGGESLEEPKRRRYRSLDEKRRLVALSYEPGASVALVARRHDVNANLLFNWRRRLGRQGQTGTGQREPMSFAPVEVVPDPRHEERLGAAGLIEIELPGGARVRVDGQVSEPALRRVLSALKAAS
jgi:transposase